MYYSQRFTPNHFNNNQNDERFGFIGPFILGGITGGLIANNKNQNCTYCTQPIYYTYPMGPCCRKF